jgi:hypothetical protein
VGALTEWESRGLCESKDGKTVFTYIYTYIHMGTISGQTGDVEKTVTARTYLISTLALYVALPAYNRLTRSGRWMEKRCKEKIQKTIAPI